MLNQIRTLVLKELTLEWRQKYALNGILLYVVSAVFITYLSVGAKQGNIGIPTWNALYWIIILFSAVNAVAKSFVQEHQGRQLYYYMIASPEAIIVSKIVYNAVLTLVLALLGYLVFSVILGNPVQDQGLFILNLVLGSLGFSACLTMVSGIASKASNNATLMAILSFPVIIPILLMTIRVSKNAIDGLDWSVSVDKIVTLLAINAIISATAYILFPYLWRS
ncbi:ABC-type transport system involved in cytochrome c biogenesis, permease component [Belliella baltica DSM 15883]|uniref:ABC-type transport system involved in cytochrome c biogenesis, permease component n=1 Tax=Belliella baltica (strain DSM 15883 / CIP 108006 / LMG 21964 / BA134) TaxID=866536 RepID=I3Z2A6_BELBD|nr:heme exporter protein CcmB [Belliella baltica]AFL83374.1 ABC-type transport system involved in cytochrome c biogenesis, permease component [Belliella baltica DSM 15883]